ncbi:YebC/PmpR family DNA-binding transcriptional regulator [Herpetosiphon giganteus]|uniref:YebC/PmpR family DNA-binding transcriptional regulator n=1 Tax=Herpetosiphon giganteus TaxID=2029754 RepID=UPI0019592F4F|nr:YebC/PmpR family DNA-binding transcriptional regulator [Herpetosiphon giganteus]MBM7842897.1 YebC/PmpR family DNA-binding regulatory protein [Herpetosiphon giganteus]
MSGHTKWHEIRRKKGVLDQRRGQRWTKIARDITIAAREGGGSPDMNFRLRLAIEKAKADNMPADNIQRAIDRGTGVSGEAALEEVTYEGYGPGGIAVIVDAATDNRNRTVSEIRTAFNKNGGTLGEGGSVGWMFDIKGLINIDRTEKTDPDEVTLLAIDADADDVIVNDDTIIVYTEFSKLAAVRDALNEQGLKISTAEKTMLAKTIMEADEATTFQILRLMERLEDLDDVQKVYSNLEISDELAEKYAEQG